MSTNPQSPQGSPSEARGSQPHPHPVAEGRQSPGLDACPFCGGKPDYNVDRAWIHCPTCGAQGPFPTAKPAEDWNRRAALAAPGASQEEGPGAADLEADLQAIEEFMKRAGLFGDEKIRNHVKARAEEAVHRLRAQAPASSPRDLEAARKSIDVIIGCYEDMAFHAGKEGFNEAQRSYEIARDAVEKKLAAHPPKGETPSEAAGLGHPTGDCASCGHPAYAGQTRCHCPGGGPIKPRDRARPAVEKAARAAIEAARDALDWYWNEDGKHSGEGREEMEDLLRYVEALEATLDGSGPTEGWAA